jgi:hypothetical protein
LSNWLNTGRLSDQSEPRARLYWGVIEALIAAQTQQQPPPPVEVALAYLGDQHAQLHEEDIRRRLEQLLADMRSCTGLGGGTITELFEHNSGSLSRPLLLFCLREHCTDLLEFSHPLLSEAEYVLAGILFGVRENWLQPPSVLRDSDLSAYVMYRMADAEHRKQDDGVILDPPSHPTPLRELFTLANAEQTNIIQDAALELAHKYHWNDCIQTRVTLAQGDYPESFLRNGLEIVLPGAVTTVTKVNAYLFLRQLERSPSMTVAVQSELRKKLAKPRRAKKRKA